KETGLSAVFDQHDIEEAVAIEIAEGAAPPDHRSKQVCPGMLWSNRFVGPLFTRVPEKLHWLLVRLPRLNEMNLRLQMSITAQKIRQPVEGEIKEEQAEFQNDAARSRQAFDERYIGEQQFCLVIEP